MRWIAVAGTHSPISIVVAMPRAYAYCAFPLGSAHARTEAGARQLNTMCFRDTSIPAANIMMQSKPNCVASMQSHKHQTIPISKYTI
jgi:hypothetical protein